MKPSALAYLCGVKPHDSINGKVRFLPAPGGCEAEVELHGQVLPGTCTLSLLGAPGRQTPSARVYVLPELVSELDMAKFRFYIGGLTPNEAVGLVLALHDGPDSSRDTLAAQGVIREYVT